MTLNDDDLLEAAELERVADWRIKKLGADPTDRQSAAAAGLLQNLAGEVRRLRDAPVWTEYVAICGWIDEFDGGDFAQQAHAYRLRIGVDLFPESGEAYLRALIGLARKAAVGG